MKSRNVLVAACAAVLAIFVILLIFAPERARETQEYEPIAVAKAAQEAATDTPRTAPVGTPAATPEAAEQTAAASAAPFRLAAELLAPVGDADGGVTALVGITAIAPEDLAEMEAQQAAGGEGAGARGYFELANVREWIPARVIALPDGEAGVRTLLSPDLPDAPFYRVAAYTDRGTLWLADVFPAETEPREVESQEYRMVPQPIEPIAPTGLRLRLVNDTLGQGEYLLRLSRRPAEDALWAEDASRIGGLLGRMAPAIAAAYREEAPLAVTVDEAARLAPLYPDPAVRLTLLTVSGVEAEPMVVELAPGQIVEAELDIGALFGDDAAAGLVDLRGRLVREGSGEPIAGALVERPGAPGQNQRITDEDGRFVFEGLPRARETKLRVLAAGPGSEFPATAEEEMGLGPRRAMPRVHWLTFDPVADALEESATEAEVTFEVPQFRWLLAEIDERERERLAIGAKVPYPIYVLERYDEGADAWRETGAEEFLREADGIAVSIEDPGIYRVVAARSAVDMAYSEPALVENGEARTPLDWEFGRETQIYVEDAQTGRPVGGAYVAISGPYGSLPPLEGETAKDGYFETGSVSVGQIEVFAGYGDKEGTTLVDLDEEFPSTITVRIGPGE
ncbi:MAG: carboxypeptidase-like regulatory domain-containing protein [Sumerlaeia bacterium]